MKEGEVFVLTLRPGFLVIYQTLFQLDPSDIGTTEPGIPNLNKDEM